MIELNLYNGEEKITFDENRHIFRDAKGKKLLSVTGATGVVDKSGALMYWATREAGAYILEENEIVEKGYFDIYDKEEKKRRWRDLLKDLEDKQIETSALDLATGVLNGIKEYRARSRKAADIGTIIHEWVSDWILKKNPEMPSDEKVVNGIMAFLKFQKEHKFKWLESERYIFSKKYRYAGILDSIAREGDKLLLVDFKSSNGIYDDMRFQVSGYKIAWEEETGRKIDERMILRFGKNDGEFEIRRLDNDAKDKKAFLNCLALKNRLKELDKKK